MALLGNLIRDGILLALLATPWLVALRVLKQKKRFQFLRINLISLPIILALIALLAYWPHFYRDFRLSLMRFDFEGMSNAERVQQVSPEYRELANDLYQSGMGIGWTLQALIGMVIFFPYPFIVTVLIFWIKGWLNKRTTL